MTARDVPFKILISVEAVGSATGDRAFDISLVRFDVFAMIIVSVDVFPEIGNRKMKLRLPHHTYLSSCRWKNFLPQSRHDNGPCLRTARGGLVVSLESKRKFSAGVLSTRVLLLSRKLEAAGFEDCAIGQSVRSVLMTLYRNAAVLGLSFRPRLDAAENSRPEASPLSSMSVCRVLCDEAET